MKISKLLLSIFLLSVLFISCDDDDEPQLPKGDYENGIIVSGEGGTTGSVYYLSDDYATIESQIYNKVNSEDLGSYLQSIAFDDTRAFIVVDNQNTITVVDRYTFEKEASISTDLMLPRYMTVYEGIGYATNWGSTADDSDDFVAVIDLSTYQVTSTISVGNGPERIVAENGKLYVSHKGAWSTNDIVSVIDIASKGVSEITVKDNPDELFIDNNGDLVVLCEGLTISYNDDWSPKEKSPVSITKINTTTNTVDSEIIFGADQYPSLLTYDGSDYFYNLGSMIYKLDDSATALPTSELLDTGASNLYGLAVENDILYTLDANFSAESSMDIYDISTKLKTNSVAAPIGASKIYFN